MLLYFLVNIKHVTGKQGFYSELIFLHPVVPLRIAGKFHDIAGNILRFYNTRTSSAFFFLFACMYKKDAEEI